MNADQDASQRERLARLLAVETRIRNLQARHAHDPAAVAAGLVAPTPDDIAAALELDDIVVDIMDEGEQPAVFVVRRSTASDSAGRARADVAVTLLEKGRLSEAADAIEHAGAERGGRVGESRRMCQALEILTRALLPAAVARPIAGARRVFLVPHGLTSRLPLVHLRLPDGTPLMTAARSAAVIPSAGLLIRMRRPDTWRNEWIGRAAPDLTLLAVAADAIVDRRIGLVDYEVHGVAASYGDVGIRCCPSNTPGPQYRLDRDSLLEILGSRLWIHALHLSSHGFVLDPNRPGSVALMLHGPDDAPRALTAHEIASRMQAVVDLVVITSCWSGQVSHGHEAGGVTAAFLRGALSRSLVVCLWPVEDRAAALFGTILHQEWRANGGRALAEAFVRTRDRLARMRELEAIKLLRWVPFASGLIRTAPSSGLAVARTPLQARRIGRPGRVSDPHGDGPAVSLVDLAAFQLVGDPDLRPWFAPCRPESYPDP